MLNDFIKCYTENSLSLLIVSGNPSQTDLSARFTDIIIEYHDLVGSDETKTMLMMRKKAVRMQSKIQQVILFTQAWLLRPNKELKDKIGKLGFHFEASKSHEQILKLLEAHVKNWKIDLENMQKDIDQYIAKKKAGDKLTRKTFLENIVAMKKEGFDIDMMRTMTDEYAVAVSAYNQLIQLKQQKAA